ncbi:protein kinase domain-containing protein [Nocardioides flavescens]|uniref:Protein kinase n=1 Tax=Nocardioides flavescens TaxID=2691959 RepID=A0A6L7ELE4_9ACTN|nr:protein kinase [Nocardioides flavescens]
MTTAPETPARGVPTVRPGSGAGAAAPRVGGYQLLSRIGEGGMGVVHLARRDGGPRVALKVLRPQVVGDDEARHRLAREVASLSLVRSRWVAEIVDADPWAPVPYVATRYVPGLSLHDHVHEEGPVTGRDLTWFAACLAEGLASVHAVGVLHRDVKPSNVLMEGRTPILIDFGLARVADDPKLTHTGWLLGTPGYLAPEILYGDDATTAADVHSWASTVAFAAIGRAPFGRGPSMAIMDRVRRGEHDLDGVPVPLRHLLAECLDPEPARRPTLDAVLGWLRPQVAPGAAQPPGPVPSAHVPLPLHSPVPPAPPTVVARPRPGVTAPYAAAPVRPAEQLVPDRPTDVLPGSQPGPTRYLDGGAPYAQAWPAPLHEPPVGAVERARRGSLLVVLALVVGGLVSLWPWWSSLVLVVAVWLLRAGSLAASRAGDRRRLRGRRWYDGVLVAVRTPWDLVRSLVTTLVLVLWAAGLAVAGALLCYAFAAGESLTLFVCGTVFVIATWSGPGGSRLRSPVGRVVRPVARQWRLWLPVAFVLLLLATSLGALAESRGPSWSPGSDRPLSGPALDDVTSVA